MRLASCSSSILIDTPHAPDGDVLDRVAYVVAETTIDLRMIPVGFFDNSTLSIHLRCCMTLGAGCLNIIERLHWRPGKPKLRLRLGYELDQSWIIRVGA
jgi:hypothetical protein